MIDVKEYYEKYSPMVLRRCLFLLKNEEDALEAMQDTFVSLLNKQNELKHAYPSSLLFRISTNISLNIIRKRRKTEDIKEDELHSLETTNGIDYREILLKIFCKEDEKTALIAILHFIDGMTLDEVSIEVSMSVSGVRKRLRKLKEGITQLKEVEDE